jgi:hypothetical protein
MTGSRVSAQRLRDLATDLAVEARQLGVLVEGLSALAEAWERSGAGAERADAAALRLRKPDGSLVVPLLGRGITPPSARHRHSPAGCDRP